MKFTPLLHHYSISDLTTQMGSSRVFIVTNIELLHSHLEAVVDCIRPEKAAMKEQFFSNQRKRHLLDASSSPSDEQGGGGVTESVVPSKHVVDAFRRWSDDAVIPRGDIDVVMAMLSPLEAFVAADMQALANLPVSETTKKAIVAFFSSKPAQDHETSTTTMPTVHSHIAAKNPFDFTPMQPRPSNVNANQNATKGGFVSTRDPRIRSHHTPFVVHVQNGMKAFANKKPVAQRNSSAERW